jgi:hypothetical protein
MKRIVIYIVFAALLASLMGCHNQNEAVTNAAADPQKGSAAASQTCQETPSSASKITITAPCDRAQVAYRDFVEGTVSDPNTRVWVVIHPQEVGDYWVQPSVTVRNNGKWRVLVYFGEPEHSGKPYEVVAIANPREPLKEGQLFKSWPEAQWRSDPVYVVRK